MRAETADFKEIGKRWVRYLISGGIFFFFLLQVLGAAFYTDPRTAPDEQHHVASVQMWSEAHGFQIEKSDEELVSGPLNQTPYLYYWLLAPWYWVKPLTLSPFTWLRLPNVLFAALAFLAASLFLRLAGMSWFERTIVLFCFSNILGWVFLAGNVNYDNLTNLMSYVCFASLAWVVRERSIRSFLLLASVCLLGCLVKIVFLPLSLGFALCAFFFCRRDILSAEAWKKTFGLRSGKVILLSSFLLSLAAFRLYGLNYIHYKNLSPACEDVYPAAECEARNPFSKREKRLIEATRDRPRMSAPEYLLTLPRRLEDTTFGIVGTEALTPEKNPQQLERNRIGLALVGVSVLLSFAFSSGFRRHDLVLSIVLISTIYFGTLFLESWKAYKLIALSGVAMHGRYFFPLTIPLLCVGVMGLRLWPKPVRISLSLLLALLFAGSGIALIRDPANQKVVEAIFPGTTKLAKSN